VFLERRRSANLRGLLCSSHFLSMSGVMLIVALFSCVYVACSVATHTTNFRLPPTHNRSTPHHCHHVHRWCCRCGGCRLIVRCPGCSSAALLASRHHCSRVQRRARTGHRSERRGRRIRIDAIACRGVRCLGHGASAHSSAAHAAPHRRPSAPTTLRARTTPGARAGGRHRIRVSSCLQRTCTGIF
jgi:hypothetical protein